MQAAWRPSHLTLSLANETRITKCKSQLTSIDRMFSKTNKVQN
uniref:Uncharacterized protein n=1 Tax=Arundo donax TaxID=35708 RepID=A0A0A9HP63_ARUDO